VTFKLFRHLPFPCKKTILLIMAVLSMPRLVGLFALLSQALGLVLHNQLANVPAGWALTGTPSSTSELNLQIALKQQNVDLLESKLASVSTPGSSEYGKYLTADEVDSLFGASAASKEAVESWLKSEGVTKFTAVGDSVWFQTTVAKANKMLGTTFKTYTDASGASKLRTTEYSLPESLKSHVDLVSPTTYFGKTKAMRSIQATEAHSLAPRALPAVCNTTIVYENVSVPAFLPDCLKIIYNIGSYMPEVSSGSEIAFGNFLNQSASFSDLALFEQYLGIPSQNFSVVLVNPADGATDLPQPPLLANDGEANLDVQNIVSLSHPLPVTAYITAGSPPYFPDPVEPAGTPNENEPYLPYYEFLLAQPSKDVPQVITNSYGDEEQTVPEDYAVRVCNLIGMLGLRGVSVLESSGDEGVGASCLALDGVTPQFNPIFPATCPYITSVGGTVSFEPEIAWDGSSGGFSNYFTAPWYQKRAIATYLKNVSAETLEYYGNYVNFSGRGFPDVAAHSVHPE
jgi:tripeptidyl-peptidase-1